MSEPVLSTGIMARIAMMQMSRKKHHKLTMDQRSMWWADGIVLESVNTAQYISDR